MKKTNEIAGWLLITVMAIMSLCCAPVPSRLRSGNDESIKRQRLYYLPYKAGTRHICIQEGPGAFSHKGRSRYAIDFEMTEGTPVVAARAGKIVWVKEDSDIGGCCREYAARGNYIYILHEDGTRAVYVHLKKNGAVVKRGQVVRRGQLIGYSGNTGWSAMPHLHFQVDARNNRTRRWESIPIAFLDISGDGVPRLCRAYKSKNILEPLR